ASRVATAAGSSRAARAFSSVKLPLPASEPTSATGLIPVPSAVTSSVSPPESAPSPGSSSAALAPARGTRPRAVSPSGRRWNVRSAATPAPPKPPSLSPQATSDPPDRATARTTRARGTLGREGDARRFNRDLTAKRHQSLLERLGRPRTRCTSARGGGRARAGALRRDPDCERDRGRQIDRAQLDVAVDRDRLLLHPQDKPPAHARARPPPPRSPPPRCPPPR